MEPSSNTAIARIVGVGVVDHTHRPLSVNAQEKPLRCGPGEQRAVLRLRESHDVHVLCLDEDRALFGAGDAVDLPVAPCPRVERPVLALEERPDRFLARLEIAGRVPAGYHPVQDPSRSGARVKGDYPRHRSPCRCRLRGTSLPEEGGTPVAGPAVDAPVSPGHRSKPGPSSREPTNIGDPVKRFTRIPARPSASDACSRSPRLPRSRLRGGAHEMSSIFQNEVFTAAASGTCPSNPQAISRPAATWRASASGSFPWSIGPHQWISRAHVQLRRLAPARDGAEVHPRLPAVAPFVIRSRRISPRPRGLT
jgi:hypothetical protein